MDARLDVLLRRLDRLRETEVDDADATVGSDHHVRRLEIAMQNPTVVRLREGLGDGQADADGLPQWRPLAPGPLAEILTFDVFEGDPRSTLVFTHGVDGDDVRVVEARRGPCLEQKAPHRLVRAEQIGRDDFQGHLSTEEGVACEVHLAHRASAEGAHDAEVVDHVASIEGCTLTGWERVP